MSRQAWIGLGLIAGFLALLAAVGLAVILVAVLTGDDDEAAAGGDSGSDRCERVPPETLAAISAGIGPAGAGAPGITLGEAAAVKSNDFEQVWFVAADLEGPGLEGSGDVGVWATNRADGTGSIFAANAVAREFSDWGDGPGFNPSDDGLQDAVNCLS